MQDPFAPLDPFGKGVTTRKPNDFDKHVTEILSRKPGVPPPLSPKILKPKANIGNTGSLDNQMHQKEGTLLPPGQENKGRKQNKARLSKTWKALEGRGLSTQDLELAQSIVWMSMQDKEGNELSPIEYHRNINEFKPTITEKEALNVLRDPVKRAAAEEQRKQWRRMREVSTAQKEGKPWKKTDEPGLVAGKHLTPEQESYNRSLRIEKAASKGLEGINSSRTFLQDLRDEISHRAGAFYRDNGPMGQIIKATGGDPKKNVVNSWMGGAFGGFVSSGLDPFAAFEFAGDSEKPVYDRVMATAQGIFGLLTVGSSVNSVDDLGKLIAKSAKEAKLPPKAVQAAVEKVADFGTGPDLKTKVQTILDDIRTNHSDMGDPELGAPTVVGKQEPPPLTREAEAVQEADLRTRLEEPVEAPVQASTIVVPPKPPEAPQNVVQPPKTPIETTFLHREAERYAKDLGADVSKSPQTWKAAMEKAVKTGVPENALSIAQDALSKKRPLSDVEKMGLARRLHDVSLQREEIVRLKATGMAEPEDLARYDALTEEGKTIYEAGFKSGGSETGRALNAQKAWLTGPMDDISLSVRFESKLGRNLTKSESETVKELSTKFKAQETRINDLEARLAKAEAERVVRRGPRERGSFQRTVSKDQAKQAVDKLLGVVKVDGAGSGLGSFHLRWTDEESEALKTLVRYVYEAGASSVEHIATNVRALLPGKDISDLDLHKSIREALGEEGRNVNRGKQFGKDVLTSRDWAVQDPEVRAARNKLQAIRDEADRALSKAIRDDEWANAKGLAWVKQRTVDAAKTARTLMTTLDDSAVGRQSWLIGLTNPASWGKGVMKHWRGATKQGFEALMDDVRAGKHFEQFQNNGLELRHVNGDEMFQGRLLERIKPAKATVDMFERLFDAQTDIAASEAAESMARLMELTGRPITDAEAKVIASFVNDLTGKSKVNLGVTEPLFFAPRLAWSRFRVLNAPGQLVKAYQTSTRAGNVIAYQYAKAGGMMAGLFAAARAGGWEVSTDPASSDFGKIRKGKTVVDLTAGLTPTAQFCYRLYNSMTGEPRYIRGKAQLPYDEALWFLRKKLAPIPSVVADLGDMSSEESSAKRNNMLQGKNVVGQDTNLAKSALKTVVPINVSNQMQPFDSMSERFWNALGEALGLGVSYYEKK